MVDLLNRTHINIGSYPESDSDSSSNVSNTEESSENPIKSTDTRANGPAIHAAMLAAKKAEEDVRHKRLQMLSHIF